MKASKALLVLENAAVCAGRRRILETTNWTIFSDQHWAVVGPTGSGKSLLVDAILRKRPLASGSIRYFFDRAKTVSPSSRTYLYPGDIVRLSPDDGGFAGNRAAPFYQARWHSMEAEEWPLVSHYLDPEHLMKRHPYQVLKKTGNFSESRKARDSLLSVLDARHLLSRRLHQLSNGELRKIQIIRALMQSPQILIIEGPFAGLDADSRIGMQQILEELLRKAAIRLLLVDASLDAIPAGITHVLCVSEGRVLAKGARSEVIANPAVKALSAPRSDTRPMGVPEVSPEGGATDQTDPSFSAGRQAPGKRRRQNETPLVDMRHVSLRYGNRFVLADINWKMLSGQHWAIQGPNGSGKSSLISLILADNPQAYANDIRLFGKKRGTGESIWEIKRHIGFVAPELQRAYSGSFDCRQVVCSGFFDSIGLYRPPTHTQANAADRWMKALHLDRLSDRCFREVSEGEKRLVLIARALVKNPRLLVLDEPCAALDAILCRRILQVLDAICRREAKRGAGMHLIYITHQPEATPAAVTHVLRLENGCIVAAVRRDALFEGSITSIDSEKGV